LANPLSRPTVNKADKSLPTLATELWELIVAYLKQEALEPFKGLGRYVALGLAGAVLLASGLIVLAVGYLRVLQVETSPHWTGNWSWLPYVITIVFGAMVTALVVSRIGAAKRKKGGR
jgi:hypothetical protein